MAQTTSSDPTPAAGLRSMTGFASAQGGVGAWSYAFDLRSVNGRGLDMRLRLPDWIEGLEPAIRKRLAARLARGNVTLTLKLARAEGAPQQQLSETGLAQALDMLGRIEAAALARGLTLAPATAADVAMMRGVAESPDAAAEESGPVREAVLAAFDSLLDAFDADRAREGAALGDIVSQQIDRIEELAGRAAAALGGRADAQRAAMERALARLLEATEVPDEARLLQELALIAVKTDVAEELDRLGAHVAAARALLGAAGPVGRKLDFLSQEFNREANTLCSKAQSPELTAIGLDLKAVIDQMREQVQNIE